MPLPNPPFRWTPSRKAEAVRMVKDYEIRLATLLDQYGIAEEEYMSWVKRESRHGVSGLRSTLVQRYR